MNDKRLDVFDAMKGLAIIGVMMIHSGNNVPRELSAFPEAVISCGNRGVQIFFLISAILTYKSLSHYSDIKSKEKHSIFVWYKKKFCRLIPLYWLVNTAILAHMGMTPTYAAGTRGVTIFTYITNYLFLHGLYPWYINAISNNWYLGTLAIFIFMAPLIFRAVNSIWKAGILLALSLIVQKIIGLTIATWDYGPDTYVWKEYWIGFSIFKQLPVMAMGIILFFLLFKYEVHFLLQKFLVEKFGTKGMKVICWSCFVLLCLMIFMDIMTYADIYIFSVTFAMLILLLFCYPARMIVNKPLSILGKYSYGVYLLHPLLLGRVNAFISKYTENALFNILTSVGITLAICLTASAILVKYFEKPVIKLFQRRTKAAD